MGETIAIGDSVRLKSGGPDMTAMLIFGGVVLCQWVTIGGPAIAIHQSLLPTGALDRIDDEPDDARRSS